MTIKRLLLSTAALVGLTVATAVAQAPDPLSWHLEVLNAAKSKAPYASGTTVFVGGRRYAEGDRRPCRDPRHQVSLDLLGQNTTVRTIRPRVPPRLATPSPSRASTRTLVRIVSKLAGKPTIVQTIVVAPDGKTSYHDCQGYGCPRDSRSTACPSTKNSSPERARLKSQRAYGGGEPNRQIRRERAQRSEPRDRERAVEAASESACRGVRGAKPLGLIRMAKGQPVDSMSFYEKQ